MLWTRGTRTKKLYEITVILSEIDTVVHVLSKTSESHNSRPVTEPLRNLKSKRQAKNGKNYNGWSPRFPLTE